MDLEETHFTVLSTIYLLLIYKQILIVQQINVCTTVFMGPTALGLYLGKRVQPLHSFIHSFTQTAVYLVYQHFD